MAITDAVDRPAGHRRGPHGDDGRLVRRLHGQLDRRAHRPVPRHRQPRRPVGAGPDVRHHRHARRSGAGCSATRSPSPSATWPTRRTSTPARISTPMLIIHGDKDYRVPIGEALRLWADLAGAGKDGQVPVLPGREPLDPQARQRRGLVRDRARLPGPARARRGLAAAQPAVTRPACQPGGTCQAGGMTRAQLDKQPRDVAAMFDDVAGRYDLINDVLSLGQDRSGGGSWRGPSAAGPGERVLDLAAGTGTSSRVLHRRRGARASPATSRWACSAPEARAADSRQRARSWPATRCALPFADAPFDAVTISFGLRNVADPVDGPGRAAPGDQAGRPAGGLRVQPPAGARRCDAVYRRYLMRALPGIARAAGPGPGRLRLPGRVDPGLAGPAGAGRA